MRYSIILFTLVVLSTSLNAQSPEDSSVGEVQRGIVTQTNDFRKEHGLPAVSTDEI